MRLVSFNIQNRRGEAPALLRQRMRDIAAFVKSLRPDIIALQEVVPEAWRFLQQDFGLTQAEYTPRGDGLRQGEGVPVFTMGSDCKITHQRSFWLSETPGRPSRLPGAVHPRICSVIRAEEGPQGWWVFNLHLDHRSARVRRRSLELLKHQLPEAEAGNEPRILCGDFNMSGYRKTVRNFCHQPPGWEDATRFHPLGALRPTYLGWGPFRLAKARIDLCLHSPGLRVQAYHAVSPCREGRRLSDHRAVVVEFSPDEPDRKSVFSG